MKKLPCKPQSIIEREMFGFFDDFLWYLSPHLWTSLTEDNSTVAIDADDPRGVLNLTVGTDDNEEAGVFTTNEMFIFASDRPLYACGRMQWTEVNVNDANVAFGFADAAGANLLSDNGGGDNINSSGVLIFKVEDETTWRVACENNAVVNEDRTNVTSAGAGTNQVLEIFVNPVDGTYVEITYFCDGVQMCDYTNNLPICHRLAYASATDMDFGAYVKTGAGQTELLKVDYLSAYQKR